MARKSKKPSIATAKPAAPTSKLPADDVIAALRSIEAAILAGHKILAKIAAAPVVAGPLEPAEEKDTKTLPLPLKAESVVEDPPAPAVEPALKRGKGRPPKDPCPTCGAKSEHTGGGLFRCKVGHVFRPGETTTTPAPVPEPVKAAAAEVLTKAELPVPEALAPAITLDTLRPLAIAYVGKHGKEGLAKALAQFGSTNLSAVPEEQRIALAEALKAGV